MSGYFVDHLLVAAPDLEQGGMFLERELGVLPSPGGFHPGKGTCNALVGLSDDCYIEVLAPDLRQPAGFPLSRYLSDLEQPTLRWWSVRCASLERVESGLRNLNIQTGGIRTGSRTLTDGSELSWRLLVPQVHGLGAALPFFNIFQSDKSEFRADFSFETGTRTLAASSDFPVDISEML